MTGWVSARLRAALLGVGFALLAALAAPAAPAQPDAQTEATLDTVRARGFLLCGVSSVIGAERQDASGEWFGFGADLCRALAAATLGDARALQILIIDGDLRFEGLIAKEYDVLFAQATWTMAREATWSILFTNVVMHDRQGFVGFKGIARPRHLFDSANETVCVVENTTSAYRLSDIILRYKLAWRVLGFRTLETRNQAFLDRRCSLLTGDGTELAAFMALRPTTPMTAFPEVIGDEPISPVVRDSDSEWFEVVRWTMFALLAGERERLASDTIFNTRRRLGQAILPIPLRRLLGLEIGFGAHLRLNDDWAFQVLRQVGNYDEIWTRNLGGGSPLNLPRTENRLIEQGGLLFAPPFR